MIREKRDFAWSSSGAFAGQRYVHGVFERFILKEYWLPVLIHLLDFYSGFLVTDYTIRNPATTCNRQRLNMHNKNLKKCHFLKLAQLFLTVATSCPIYHLQHFFKPKM